MIVSNRLRPSSLPKGLFTGVCLSALLCLTGTGAFADAAAGSAGQESPASAKPLAPSVDEAAAFIEKVEKFERAYGEFEARTAWVQATYINFDTNWLLTRAAAEGVKKRVGFANEAKRFNGLALPADMRRKIEKIKLGLNVPAPGADGAAERLAALETGLQSAYETGKIELDGKSVARNDLEAMMGTIRDPQKLQEIWVKWRDVPTAKDADGRTMRDNYADMMAIANDGAKELGFADLGDMWRARYDLPSDEFAAETDRLWGQVKPLYDALHCHVRAELNEEYGDEVVPTDQPIRADLLGNMWAQSWSNIYDLVAPENADPGYDVTKLLETAQYDPVKMVKTGEAFFSSLGFAPLPETFWERSQITKPEDREVACHASAWDLDWKDDIRIKMCTKVNGDDFQTVHHELGHNYYQRAYQDQSVIFQTGANGGFHEAIGDMIALSITPDYLKSIDLLEETPDASKDIGLLMQTALEKVAFQPFGLIMDKWRWNVFSGAVAPADWNKEWWRLRSEYQGVTPPVDRPGEAFDPGSKYHIPANVSYTRYFIANILQFQFHKAACEMAGWDGPLHRCSVYGSKEVGEKFDAMLKLGASKPWPEALEAFTGTREMDGSAVVEYFAPLKAWLDEKNEGRQCGW